MLLGVLQKFIPCVTWPFTMLCLTVVFFFFYLEHYFS